MDGRLIDLCVKEILYKTNGESYTLRSHSPNEFIELLNQVGAALPLRGIVNLDIYRHEDKLVVMDINCRIGGNYQASHSFGCNLIKPMLVELMSKESLKTQYSNYPAGQIISKFIAFTQPESIGR
ncbi:MAG: hypothetical protein B7X60_01670 [Polynucleobacter sp. 39-45-136]|jgi:predicted ATP-grasp superfamily ATP-dependent carboligase|nr:MAG: hypothetical protein B7X60_01670 [Polynucleobacter sp. 39-45-136]